jgi:hypothetical protein
VISTNSNYGFKKIGALGLNGKLVLYLKYLANPKIGLNLAPKLIYCQDFSDNFKRYHKN